MYFIYRHFKPIALGNKSMSKNPTLEAASKMHLTLKGFVENQFKILEYYRLTPLPVSLFCRL